MGTLVVCSYYQHLYARFQTSNCSSIEPNVACFYYQFLLMNISIPFSCNVDMKLRQNSLHLNLYRAMLDWRCVQSLILCLLSLPCWTTCPQVLYCFLSWTSCNRCFQSFYTVSSQSSLLFSLTVSVFPSSVFSFPIHQSSVVVSSKHEHVLKS